MAPPNNGLPYKRPFFTVALTSQEIEEDMAMIITNTKRKRKASPTNGSGGRQGGSTDKANI